MKITTKLVIVKLGKPKKRESPQNAASGERRHITINDQNENQKNRKISSKY